MILDALSPDGTIPTSTVVTIVGGGVAGIVLGLELGRAGIPVTILEGGGIAPSRGSQSLYSGECSAHGYDLQATRDRRLGGSSNSWGGWVSPLVDDDFTGRPGGGWPISAADLEPYWEAAHRYLQTQPAADAGALGDRTGSLESLVARLGGDRLESVQFRMSPPTRFGIAYRRDLEESPHVTVVLNANVVEILCDSDGMSARGVRIRNERGSFDLRSRHVVLAAGGIENPRLLLASRAVHAAGIGNGHDLVGRYFMEHARLRTGRLRLKDARTFARALDFRFSSGGAMLVRRSSVSAAIAPSRRVRSAEGILQTYTGLLARFCGFGHERSRDAAEIYKAMTAKAHSPIDLQTVRRAMVHLPAAAATFVGRKVGLWSLVSDFDLETIIESVPDPANRLVLTDSVDRTGLPRVRLTWRCSELEKRTHRRALTIIRDAVTATGAGEVLLEDDVWGERWDSEVMGTWHHMGTTRMAASPRQGVVDSDCRVFGLANLHVAGSSVFPTAGVRPPTFTVVCLALRLAERLRSLCTLPAAATVAAGPARQLVKAAE